MSKPVAWLAYAPDASESSFVTLFQEQAEAAARDWGWSVEPLYAKPASQWIAVEERLPEAGEEVLACADGRRCNAEWWRGDWWHSCQGFEKRGGRMLKRVSHWMPLPEPPRDAT